jgi:syntaxin 16
VSVLSRLSFSLASSQRKKAASARALAEPPKEKRLSSVAVRHPIDPSKKKTMAATTTTIIGTTRSRTDRFLRYRAAARGGGSSQGPAGGGYGMYSAAGGADGNGASAAAMRLLDAALGPPSDAAAHTAAEGGQSPSPGLPPAPAYVAFKDAARRDMGRIRAAMAELRELHQRAALVTFDDDSCSGRDAEVSRATAAVTRLFRDCEARLSAVGRNGGDHSGAHLSEADERVRQNVRRTLAAELQQLSLQFRRQQRGFLEKLRAQQRQQGGGGGGGASSSAKAGGFDALLEGASRRGGNGFGDDDFDDGSAPYISTTSSHGFTQKQQARAGALDTLAREREAEIDRVVESISQLSEIMKDLGALGVFFHFSSVQKNSRGKKH